jgi:Ca-activated chloride channel family protein
MLCRWSPTYAWKPIMHFESPWSFLLLFTLPVLIWLSRRRTKDASIRFSSTEIAEKTKRSWRQQLMFMPLMLRTLALVCLIVALARPQTGMEEVKDIGKGIAIEMVVDRSGSMGAEMEYKGSHANRLEVVKQVFKEFVLGNDKDLHGRPSDLIGMIAFARYPDTICPLTLAHGALPPFLDSVKLVERREEDGTAIGDALALAAARLETVDETLKQQRMENRDASYEIKSKVIILLSDGENNFGKRTPLEAAALAQKWGIKVYTIAIGGGEAVASIQTPFGVYKVPISAAADTDTLEKIAEKTSGFFRKASDAGSLREIYREIDKMEKSTIESVRFVDYKEVFPFFALAGLLLIGCEIILSGTVLRKTP